MRPTRARILHPPIQSFIVIAPARAVVDPTRRFDFDRPTTRLDSTRPRLDSTRLDARAPREGSGRVEGLVEWTLEESFL